ncbi:MAG: hypothetical protein U5J99_01240 [Parvularculaceae bacterium]|nr:hypothetical protein [Parvularculaceae bacterium]
MSIIVGIALTFFAAASAAALAAEKLTPREHAIFANLLVEEFVSACVKNDAILAELEKFSVRRAWKPYPIELTRSSQYRARAWEGEVKHVGIGDREMRSSLTFVAVVSTEGLGRGCQFFTPEISFEPLRDAMKNQGFELHSKYEREDPWRYATFCSKKLRQQKRKHDLVVEWRSVPSRPIFSGSRLIFVRDTTNADRVCPQVISIGRAGPDVQVPEIEPWFRQKPDEPPLPVE